MSCNVVSIPAAIAGDMLIMVGGTCFPSPDKHLRNGYELLCLVSSIKFIVKLFFVPGEAHETPDQGIRL